MSLNQCVIQKCIGYAENSSGELTQSGPAYQFAECSTHTKLKPEKEQQNEKSK